MFTSSEWQLHGCINLGRKFIKLYLCLKKQTNKHHQSGNDLKSLPNKRSDKSIFLSILLCGHNRRGYPFPEEI